MRLLVIEDSVRLRESLLEGLRGAGYAVDEADDGREGLWLAESHPYDVIVLDWMLPNLDGLALLRAVRAAGSQAAVILLTAKDELSDKVAALRAGADDYLVKPFAFDELLARVEALVRRRHGQHAPDLCVGALRLNRAARSATMAVHRLDLPPREYAVLEYLMLRAGQIVTRSEIEAHIYDQNTSPMSNVVDTVIYALRKKLEPHGREPAIRTRRGLGYILETSA